MNKLKGILMLVVILGAVAYFYQSEAPVDNGGGVTVADKQIAMMPNVTASDLRYLGVKHLDGSLEMTPAKFSDYSSNADGTDWLLKDPPGMPVNEVAAKRFISVASNLKANDMLSGESIEKDKSVYGLDEPVLALVVETSAEKHILRFGAKHSFSPIRYAQFAERPEIYLIDERAFQALKKDKAEIWEPRPLLFQVADATEIRIEREDEDFLIFHQTPESRWTVTQDKREYVADVENLEQRIREFADTKVSDIYTGGLGSSLRGLSFGRPKLTATINLKESATRASFTAIFGEIEKSESTDNKSESDIEQLYYFKIVGNPFIYFFKGRFFPYFFQSAANFRSKQPLEGLPQENVKKISITADSTIVFSKTKAVDWKKAEPLFTKLLNLEGLNYTGFEKVEGIDSPLFKILIESETSKREIILGEPVSQINIGAEGASSGDASPRHAAISDEYGNLLHVTIDGESAEELISIVNTLTGKS